MNMKKTGIIVPVCILAAIGLAVGLMLECQASWSLGAQNDALRRQLSKLSKSANELQGKTNLLASTDAGTNAVTNERLDELEKLRRQVAELQQQNTNIQNLLADTRAVRTALGQSRKSQLATPPHRINPDATNGAPLEILQASYGTDRTNLDVSAQLTDRIRGGRLKMLASNRLAGDVDFGHVKNLTVVYRFGGAIQTNQFQEGDVVILPPETP